MSKKKELSNSVKHAISELKLMGMDPDGPKDDMNAHAARGIVEMVQKFSEQGHSGFSAAYSIGLLEKVLRFEPLSPLTGADDEWMEVTRDNGIITFQNKRCSHVFKETDAKDYTYAYDIDGKVFVDKNGSSWTNVKSRTPVTFPYVPKTVRVQRRWWKFWL